jgi:two-component system, NarL family, response regulator DesR
MRFVGCPPLTDPPFTYAKEVPVAERTYTALALHGRPPEAVDLVQPEPSVAVIAEPPLLRRRILAALDFDRLPVVAQAQTPDALPADVGEPPPDVAVIAAERGDPLGALQALGHELPGARTVLVLGRARGGPVRRALRAGASAAIEATQVETGLALAVRAAAVGLVVVPEAMRERLEPPALSPRERAILALAAEGATTAEIADRLTVSTGTVKRHLSACFVKLGVENRSEALALLLDAERNLSAEDAR